MVFSPIDEIKSRLDIVDVVGSYIKLQKAGVNYRAPCPFHSEKKPSFFVSPSRQMFHCFGCGASGDIFKFVMMIEGVEFGDALRILAQKAGVELKRQDPKIKTERSRLYEICELATQFFERQLEKGKIGISAKKYLLGRGINDISIKKWRIGYAPEVWHSLSDFLLGKGYTNEEIVKTGLAIKKDAGYKTQNAGYGTYDRFRGRIMFPIFGLSGQVVGFTGRVFTDKDKDEVAKYVNTPNTLLYDKSRILYGLDKAKVAIRKKNRCVLVEGQTDVIMSHQAGVEEAVATSGTALTSFQLKILKRYSENLVTAFDMDIAGDSATKRGIDLAQFQGFDIRVATMDRGSDPADIVYKNPKDWERIVNNSHSILEFYFESAFSKFDSKKPEGKKEISNILIPVIKRIPNKIIQAYWVGQLAKKMEVKEESIEAELKKYFPSHLDKGYGSDQETNYKKTSSSSRGDILEERIISLVLKYPETISLLDDDYFDYFSDKAREVLGRFKKKPSPEFLANLKDYKFSPELTDFLNLVSLKAETNFGLATEEKTDPKAEILTCLKEFRSLKIKDKLDKLSRDIKKAEEEKNTKNVSALAKKFNELAKNLTSHFYEDKNKKGKNQKIK